MANKEIKPSKKPVVVEDQDLEDEETDEEEEGEEDEEEEEEEEEAPAPVRASSAQGRRDRMRVRRAVVTPSHEDDLPEASHGHDDHDHGEHDEDEIDTSNDPTWWIPHVVLGAIVLIGVFGFFGAFNKVAAKLGYSGMSGLAATTEPASSPPPKPQDQPRPPEPRPMPPMQQGADQGTLYGAKHLLVMYKGSMRAPDNITRTKDEAKARAEEARKKAKAGTKFEDLVRDYSDEPGAAQRGGDLGKFPKGRMVGPFQDAVEKTKVGEISDLVETPFGYHVILRTQ